MLLPRNRRSFLVGCGLSIVLAFTVAAAAEEIRQAASHLDEKLSLPGVGNFGRMNDRLYRGAQPTNEGFAQLRAMGIDTVVRLSLGEEGSAIEKAAVESLGMRLITLPWSTMRPPDPNHVVAFLTFVKAHPERKIFVHCKAGADRTGTFVALYRIAIDRWTPAKAVAEMKAFHYRYLFLPHLQEYVEAFPARLASEPALEWLDAANIY